MRRMTMLGWLPSENAEKYANLKIERTETNGVAYAAVWRGRARKPYANYRFRSLEHREEWITRQKEAADDSIKFKAERKMTRSRQKEEAAAELTVGSILHGQWGWEQTNNNFYEIVARPSKYTVVIRELAQATTREAGFMSHYTKAIPGSYIGPELRRRITGPSIRINGSIYVTKEEAGKEHLDTNYA